MPTYAIGRINGDIKSLQQMLELLNFDKENDKLWFSGNVVSEYSSHNREVLSRIKSLGRSAVLVLGEAELSLLAIAEDVANPEHGNGYEDILSAPDRDELLKWLYLCPLLFHKRPYTMVHSGIPAEWSLGQARTFAIEAESSMSMGNHKTFFENVTGDSPTRWHAKHRGWNRVRFIINAFTRMRYINSKGRVVFDKDITSSDEFLPWYSIPDRKMVNDNILSANMPMSSDDEVKGIYAIPPLCSDQGKLEALSLDPVPQIKRFDRTLIKSTHV